MNCAGACVSSSFSCSSLTHPVRPGPRIRNWSSRAEFTGKRASSRPKVLAFSLFSLRCPSPSPAPARAERPLRNASDAGRGAARAMPACIWSPPQMFHGPWGTSVQFLRPEGTGPGGMPTQVRSFVRRRVCAQVWTSIHERRDARCWCARGHAIPRAVRLCHAMPLPCLAVDRIHRLFCAFPRSCIFFRRAGVTAEAFFTLAKTIRVAACARTTTPRLAQHVVAKPVLCNSGTARPAPPHGRAPTTSVTASDDEPWG